MKKITIFALSILAILSLGIQSIGIGQVLLDENFSYPAGDLLTAHGWTAHSGAGTQAITVSTGGLSFTGYIDSGIGNAALVDNNGEDDNKTFAVQSSGIVYTAFMVNVTTTAAGYFFHIGPDPISTTFRGRVYIDATNHFGLGVGSGTASYSTTTYTPGTTYVLVLKYEIVAGTTNDAVSLFIFDTSIPATEPAATIGPLTDGTQADINPGSVAVRQYSATQNILVDGIRVGTSWTDIFGAGIVAPTIQASNITFSGIATTGMTANWTNGDGAKRVVIMNTSNTFTNPVDGTDPVANTVYGGAGQQVVYNNSGNSVSVTGLTGSTTYWFRVYEYNGAGVATKYLTTTATNNPNSQATAAAAVAPSVSLPTATTITNTTAILGGTITADGGSVITERGTVWKTTPGVVITDNKLAEGGTTVAAFSHLRTSLAPKTLVYYKAYATNAVGTSLTTEASFYTLANEPTTHVTGFAAASGGTTSIILTWTAAATGADGYMVLQKTGAAAPTGIPADATGYTVGSALGDGTVAAIVTPASLLTKTITGLSSATMYSFTIIPFAWDGTNNATYNYYSAPVIPAATATTTGAGSITYTWQGANNGLWTTAANWNPTRTVPANNDILLFNDGTVKTVTAVPTETIGKIALSNNTTINLQSAAAVTVTMNGVAGADLDIPAGCSLNLNAANVITLALATTATASISGNMTFSSTIATAHRLTAVDPAAITFNSGSVFTAGTFFSGNPFGTTSLGSVIFASGSTFIQQAGSNPFGATQPNSVTVFLAGSLFKVIANLTPAFSGRTYANFEVDATGVTLTPTGGSPVSLDNLTVTNGTLNFNMTGPTTGIHQIHGNISVAAGGILNFSPASAGTVTFNGTAAQSISGPGPITTSTNSILEISNASGLNLNTLLTVNGQVKLTSGLFTLGSSNLVLGTTGTMTGTPSATAMVVATGTGQLQKGFATGFTGSFTYPVGDNTVTPEYSPVTVTFASGTFAAGNLTGVNLVNAKYPSDPNTISYIKRYWNVTSSGITAFTCSAICQYLPADVVGTEAQTFSMRVFPMPFTDFGLVDAAQHQLNITGLTAFGTFTGSQPAPAVQTLPASSITPATATLNGSVIANYNAAAISFEYGLTTAYGTTVPGIPASANGGGSNSTLANITGLTLNTTYHFRVNATNSSGTTNGADLNFVTGCPIPTAAGTITGPANVCVGGTGYVYTVPSITYATTYNWTVPAGAIITAGSNTNSITVSFPAGASSGNVSVYGSSVCGSGSGSPTLAVTVNPLPVPTITGPASVCVNSSGNVYTTQAGMTGYAWTVSAGGTINGGATTNSITVTWATAGPNTVTATYTNAVGCNPATPASFAVTVVPFPSPTITGPAVVCANAANIVYTTEAGMTLYNWSVSIGGTIIAGAGTNAITVSWPYPGNRSVSVTYTNPTGCSATVPTVYNVTINPAAVPFIGSGNNPCIGSTNNQYITNSGMFSYVWAVSAGGTIVSGQGTNTLNVTWNAIGAQWVSVTFTNSYGCSAVTPTMYNLFVNPLPNAAGAITGTAAVCGGTNGVAYSCAEILNATSYTWTLPAGATIAGGAGTKSITVNFGPSAVSGNITVAGTNTCGNGTVSPAFAVTVNPLPAAAGAISGAASVCAGATGVAYSVPTIAIATTYVWTVPAGATITSGGTSKNIVVSFGPTPGTGVITVKGTNTCGAGTISPNFNVTINAVPSAPTITAAGNVLTSSASSGNQWYYAGTAIPGATGQTYTVISNTGYYWCVVTVNGCSSPISNKVWVVVTGEQELQNSSFNIYPVPNDGRFTVNIISASPETFSIQVFNQLGTRIFELGDVHVNGTFEKQIDLRPVASGIYTVIFLNSEHKVVRKVVVNK
ncbi:MAG: T9SS type A sorting domain-containing protein [bacterium]